MAQQTINVGTAPNDGTGTPLRTAFQYTNSNFSELYTAVGPSGNNIVVPGSATITGDLTVRTNQLIANANGVGVGTAPSAWSGIGPAIQVEQASLLSEASNQLYLTANGYFSGGQWNYINNASADQYYQIAGSHVWRSGIGGAGGTAIGWSTLMTLNSTGLGVGVASPSAKLDVAVTGAGTPRVRFTSDSDNPIVEWQRFQGTATNYYGYRIQGGFGALAFLNSNVAAIGSQTWTQAMTLDASGNLLVGTTTNAGVRLDVQTATGNCIGRVKSNAAASTASFIIDYVETLGCTYIKKAGSDVWIYGVQNDTSATPAFKINTASNVGVQLVSGATAWTTLSDETVKDIIEPISNAVAKVGSIRSVIGKFKTDDSKKRRSFLIAQDVQSVLPEAVDVVGENNELGLRYTEVIPLLVAAIKELTARVQTLETR